MKYELVKNFLSALFYSWGSDAPSECVWAANDFLKILEDMYNYKFENEFSESYDDEYPDNNYEVVLEEIKNLLEGKKFEAKKNKIDKNHVISHPDSLPKETPKDKEQLQGGVDIKSFEPEFKYNFNSTTEDDDIKEKDAEEFIKVHKKHLMTFESFSQDFCGCCERCNCTKYTVECYCHCDECICHSSDIKSIGESNETIDDDSESEPWYEPEWCEECSQNAEESGIEYEPNFTWKGDYWECDNCRRPC